MTLNFPDSPIEGETYNGYVYDATNSLWKVNYPTSETISVPDGIVSGVSGASVTTTTVGDDTVYSFLDDGTITVETAGYFDVLLVGGGGGGAKPLSSAYGIVGVGGGGAGGVLYIENAYLPAGSLDVVVGAGGAGARVVDGDEVSTGYLYVSGYGKNGFPSSLWNYYVPGGGGGGANLTRYDTTGIWAGPGMNGASGGGAGGAYNSGADPMPGGLGVSGIGNNGGGVNATAGSLYAGGGGGGAGAVGSDASGSGSGANGGNGGNGVSNSITGSAVTYGGGGGGSGGTGTDGTGGTGGGGNAGDSPQSGTANTGGGGGAASLANVQGGTGGSGIVIVRERGSSGS